MSLVKLNAGATVSVERVNLTIKGVQASALLVVRLDNVANILNNTLDLLGNPEIIKSLLGGLNNVVGSVGGVVDNVGGALGGVGNIIDSVGGVVGGLGMLQKALLAAWEQSQVIWEALLEVSQTL